MESVPLLRSPRPVTLAHAAEQFADLLRTSPAKLIERRDANQGYDFFYRLRGAGLNVELRSACWEHDLPQQDFRVSGLSVGGPAWRVLVEQGGWQPMAGDSWEPHVLISSVNESLRRCLGGAEVCGYQPVGFEERLREALDAATPEEQALMRSALDLEWSPSQWARGDLSADAAAYEVMLKDRFPELEALVIRALASRWAYQWR